ncbi:MAG: hypothetical protein EBQ96_00980 [Proteobacteria bacterium]|nr:hypothetical protein [Pseudomonadota bacterium]
MACLATLLRSIPRLLALGVCLLAAVPAYADTPLATPRQQPLFVTDTLLPEQTIDIDTLSKLHLSDKDAALYARIFSARARGNKAEALSLTKKLGDRSLVDWAQVRQGREIALWMPQKTGSVQRLYKSPVPRDKKAADTAADIMLSVSVLLKTDDIERALEVTRRAAGIHSIDRIEIAQLYAKIATARLHNTAYAEAASMAHLALQIAGPVVPEAAWVAGLANWTQGHTARAAQYFTWIPASPYAGPWMRSAAAYWTARAMMREGHYNHVSAWLLEAAKNPRSFYGLIATRALGTRFDFNWSVPRLTDTHIDVLKKHRGAVRALKLAQAGQFDMARIELALLDEAEAPLWREALAALTVATLKPDVVMKVASILETPEGKPMDMALYPVAPWQPRDGYRLDPALIHAFVRQESGFQAEATNKTSGATGLLQLLPRTARTLDKTMQGDTLKNPRVSMALGQQYLEDLLDMTDGNLFEAAIAYNAGPGNLAIWKDRFANLDDPLLFIELVPYSETRAYVERVMANYWIYSLRMGYGVASLDAVAAGAPAVYATYAQPRDRAVYAAISANSR